MSKFKFMPWKFPENAIHISIDIETADTSPSAAILQLAAVTKGHFFESRISVASNEKANRSFSTETMEWWSTKDPKLRNYVFSGDKELEQVLQEFVEWCRNISGGELDRICLWGNGCNFDNVIVKDAIEQFFTWPFSYRNDHHLRTLMALVPEDVQERAANVFLSRTPAEAHNALWDAKYQMYMIERALIYHGIQTN